MLMFLLKPVKGKGTSKQAESDILRARKELVEGVSEAGL